MRKIISMIIAIIIPIAIVVLMIVNINSFLDINIENLMRSKQVQAIRNQYGSHIKDRGILFNRYSIKNDDVLLQGSSELSSQVSQNPRRFFPVEGMDRNINFIGKAHVQDLQHASILGSQNNVNNKTYMLSSLQWFLRKDGMESEQFQSVFSSIQYYYYMDNPKISKETKEKYALRMEKLLVNSSEFSGEYLHAKLYNKKNFLYKIEKVILSPYFKAKKELLMLKDKYDLFRELSELKDKEDIEKRNVNWSDELRKAEEEGKKEVKGTPYNMSAIIYDKFIKDVDKKMEGSSKGQKLDESLEYEDFQIYLDTCKDLGVKPCVIIMPTNGYWYDHVGLKKEERDKVFSRVRSMTRKMGFEVLDLSNEEYTPYFICDAMHLGWKGWLKVDEKIYSDAKNK